MKMLLLAHMSSLCILYTHSCVNPILYALIREDLKLKVCSTIKCFLLSCKFT